MFMAGIFYFSRPILARILSKVVYRSSPIEHKQVLAKVGGGGMRGYLQFLLAPLCLKVILVTKEISKILQKFSILVVCPPKTPIFA